MALRVKIIATDKLSGTLLRVGKSVMRLGVRFAKMGAIAALAISAIAIKLQKDLDVGLREIGTLMGGLTDNEIRAMTKELEKLASQSGQAITSLTKARYDIVSAGFIRAADAAEVLNASTILAVGGVTEVSVAADLLTTALNAYSKSAKEAIDVSDILFTIVRLGKTTMDELGSSLGILLAITGEQQISLVEVGAALATLTAGGQKTSIAITGLRAAIIELIKPQTILKRLIKDTTYETTRQLLAQEGFAGALKVIKEESIKANVPMTELFGSIEAMQAVLPLTGIAFDKFADNIRQFEDRAGAAESAYDEMQKSFDIATKKMRRNIENMLRSLGRELIKKIQPKIDNFNKEMEKLGELNWQKLGNILINNWAKILIALGEMVIAGGKFIGTALIDSIVEGIDDAIPKLNQTLALLTATMITLMGAMGMPNVIVKGLLKVIEKVSDLELTGKDVKTAFEEFKTTISEIASRLTFLSKAFGDINIKLKGTLENFDKLGTIKLFEDITINPLIFTSIDILDKKWLDFIKKFEKGFFVPTPSTLIDLKALQDQIDAAKGMFEKFTDWYKTEAGQQFIDTAQQITNAVGDVYNNFLRLRKAQIQSELDAQISAVLTSGLAEEEKQAKISNLREAARQKELAAAKKLKPIKLAQAISNTALAVASALAIQPPSPWNLILASIVGIAGAAEVATIAAQPYARGGFVRMGGNIPASDTIPAMLAPNEIVSTAAASERFGAEIQRLNQLAEGGGFGGAKGDTFYIYALDSQSLLDAIQADPAKFADAQRLIKSERF